MLSISPPEEAIADFVLGFPRTIVTWKLDHIGNNKTRVELVHSAFIGAADEMYGEHKEGSYYYLDKLAIHCNFKMQAIR